MMTPGGKEYHWRGSLDVRVLVNRAVSKPTARRLYTVVTGMNTFNGPLFQFGPQYWSDNANCGLSSALPY